MDGRLIKSSNNASFNALSGLGIHNLAAFGAGSVVEIGGVRRDRKGLRSKTKSHIQAENSGTDEFVSLADNSSATVTDTSTSEQVLEELEPSPERTEAQKGEDDLIKRSLSGDHQAFEVLVRRYSPRVFSIIGSFYRRRDMVEDIAQDVFSRAYFSLASFTLGRSFEAWVAKIAVNACYDQLRAQRRRMEYQMPLSADHDDEWFEMQMLDVAQARHSSAERQREAADTCERLLSRIDPEDRIVLVLMDRDGYSVKEISDLTGWGQSKVKVRAFRARRTLRAAMKRLMMSAERKQRGRNEPTKKRKWDVALQNGSPMDACNRSSRSWKDLPDRTGCGRRGVVQRTSERLRKVHRCSIRFVAFERTALDLAASPETVQPDAVFFRALVRVSRADRRRVPLKERMIPGRPRSC